MKSLTQFIYEVSMKEDEMLLSMIEGNSFTKSQLTDMLSNLDLNVIKKISDKLASKYADEYFPYEPSKDMFISNTNKDKIVSNISDFLIKYVCKS